MFHRFCLGRDELVIACEGGWGGGREKTKERNVSFNGVVDASGRGIGNADMYMYMNVRNTEDEELEGEEWKRIRVNGRIFDWRNR